MANINDFKSRLAGGGARANQFKVTLPFPGYAAIGGETSDLAFLCTATAIPGQTVASVPVNFRGRVLNLAGDRTFNPWSITVLNDTDFKIYRAMERWMNGINNMTDNEGLTNPSDYQVDGFVDHLDRNGTTIKSYTYRGLFPTALDDIALDYGTNNAIETFGVTFTYQYFETDTTT
tara:strand:+ start:460 stop:987 length:528 start_codon:yes stop_codon:yes gene_type:complete